MHLTMKSIRSFVLIFKEDLLFIEREREREREREGEREEPVNNPATDSDC